MWRTPWNQVSGVTVELRNVVESGVNIWAFDYPSYYKDEEKTRFEQLVLDHYWTRQIGFETVGRFLHMFRTKIREIMPYYIDMYKTVEIMRGIEDPFGNVDVTETYSETRSSEGSMQSNSESNSEGSESRSESSETASDHEHRYSKTPQGSIENLDRYLTEAARDHDTRNINDSSEGSHTDTTTANGSTEHETSGRVEHTLHRKGNQGVNTYAHDMIEFRTSIINVDMMIINELNELFLGVY